MKITEYTAQTQDQQIAEIADLFSAIGLYKVMLSESRLDEAGVWNAVKSMVGKGVAGVKNANDAIDRLGRAAQNTAPVQGFDSKVEGILTQIGNANPKIAEAARKYGEWAKKNPVKQGIIIGILTAVAGLVSGPGGAAAAAAVLRASNGILKGEKASSAIGGAVKSAAFGWMVGLGLQELGALVGHIKFNMFPLPGYKQIGQVKIYAESIGSGVARIDINAYLPTSTANKLYQLFEAGQKYIDSGDYAKAQSIWNKAKSIVENPELQQQIKAIISNNEQLLSQASEGYRQLTGLFSGLGAAAQGAIAGAGSKSKTPAEPAEPGATAPAEPAATAPAATAPSAGSKKPLSQTKDAIRKRNKRAADKTVKASPQATNIPQSSAANKLAGIQSAAGQGRGFKTYLPRRTNEDIQLERLLSKIAMRF
jgi:hypothetical protein